VPTSNEISRKDLNADISKLDQAMDTIEEGVEQSIDFNKFKSTNVVPNQIKFTTKTEEQNNFDSMSDKGANVTTANREELKSFGGFDVLSRNTGGFDMSV